MSQDHGANPPEEVVSWLNSLIQIEFLDTTNESQVSLGHQVSKENTTPVIRIEASEPDSKKGAYTINRLLQSRIDNSDDVELPDALLEREELSQHVRGVVEAFTSRLNETQRGVFQARFLTDDGEPDTFEAIGERLNGLTKQRIQQIDAELKVKFKKYLTHNQISLRS